MRAAWLGAEGSQRGFNSEHPGDRFEHLLVRAFPFDHSIDSSTVLEGDRAQSQRNSPSGIDQSVNHSNDHSIGRSRQIEADRGRRPCSAAARLHQRARCYCKVAHHGSTVPVHFSDAEGKYQTTAVVAALAGPSARPVLKCAGVPRLRQRRAVTTFYRQRRALPGESRSDGDVVCAPGAHSSGVGRPGPLRLCGWGHI